MKINLYRSPVILVCILISAVIISAQDYRKTGIELFKSGKNEEAIDALKKAAKKDSKDPEIWNYLGLSYLNIDDVKNGRKAFERSVKINETSTAYLTNLAYANLLSRKPNKTQDLCHKAIAIDPGNANAYFIRGTSYLWESQFEKALADTEKAIELRPKFSASYLLKADILLFEFGNGWAKAYRKSDTKDFAINNLGTIEKAVETLNVCEKTCEKDDQLQFLAKRKTSLEAFHRYFSNKANPPDPSIDDPDDPAVKKLNILTKPRPNYTNSARSAGVQGEIFISVVFDADRSVKHIFVLKGLGNGLDEQAVSAASKITFEPAERNGIAFSTIKIIQYNFTIY